MCSMVCYLTLYTCSLCSFSIMNYDTAAKRMLVTSVHLSRSCVVYNVCIYIASL